MRYLLIDRIQRLELNREILAIKNVSLSEDIYSEHFFGCPVMPGALLLESLAQAGTALLEVSANFQKKALLVMVERAKFRVLVRPGDQLSILMNMLSLSPDAAQLEGGIRIAGRLAVDARLTFTLEEADRFYPPRTRHLMDTLYEVWLKDAELVGFKNEK